MIREYCDRCSRPVGDIFDGGAPVKKVQLENVLALLGRKRDFVACPICFRDLHTLLTGYFERRNG